MKYEMIKFASEKLNLLRLSSGAARDGPSGPWVHPKTLAKNFPLMSVYFVLANKMFLVSKIVLF